MCIPHTFPRVPEDGGSGLPFFFHFVHLTLHVSSHVFFLSLIVTLQRWLCNYQLDTGDVLNHCFHFIHPPAGFMNLKSFKRAVKGKLHGVRNTTFVFLFSILFFPFRIIYCWLYSRPVLGPQAQCLPL